MDPREYKYCVRILDMFGNNSDDEERATKVITDLAEEDWELFQTAGEGHLGSIYFIFRRPKRAK